MSRITATYIMTDVCPFFLIEAQRPLKSTIITDVKFIGNKSNSEYLVTLTFSSETSLNNFNEALEGRAERFNYESAYGTLYHTYVPKVI